MKGAEKVYESPNSLYPIPVQRLPHTLTFEQQAEAVSFAWFRDFDATKS